MRLPFARGRGAFFLTRARPHPKPPKQKRGRDMLAGQAFDTLCHSPLERAAHTARIVWADRPGAVVPLPALREVDLYAFQARVREPF